MPKIIITQKIPEPAKEGNWYQLADVKIEYDPVELVDVLSIMDELEEKYSDPDDRWWALRSKMAGQKYAQKSVKRRVEKSLLWIIIVFSFLAGYLIGAEHVIYRVFGKF